MAPKAGRALEFGIYRDGDNNLDESQMNVLTQARDVSLADRSIAFTVENTTSTPVTQVYTLSGGFKKVVDQRAGIDMSDPDNLASFVARTLDNAEASGAKQTWIDLVDHGAGDGGGLEADTYGGVMPMQSIADAMARGEAMHAKAHPEDANRNVDGVVANQCLMSTLGFADALSHAGVRFLAASPETMVSPGVPSSVAEAIASNTDDARAMAKDVVDTVMKTRYVAPGTEPFAPAAAFDVLDLAPSKLASAERAIKTFNDDAAEAAKTADVRAALRADIRHVQGMVRFPEATSDMPWHSDRPAMAVYDRIASDSRLSDAIRKDAAEASAAVHDLVLAHRESGSFEPFGGSSYEDAAGPTIHDPVTSKQIDPWAPSVSETKNRFYTSTDQGAFVHAIA
jgi:Clostripain family